MVQRHAPPTVSELSKFEHSLQSPGKNSETMSIYKFYMNFLLRGGFELCGDGCTRGRIQFCLSCNNVGATCLTTDTHAVTQRQPNGHHADVTNDRLSASSYYKKGFHTGRTASEIFDVQVSNLT